MNAKPVKKILSVGLAVMMSGCLVADPAALKMVAENTALVAEAATASGTCGTNLYWSLSGTTLTISGIGSTMNSYWGSSYAPWYSYRSTIKKVIFPTTLKKIGAYAFYNMTALEYVYTSNLPCLPNLTEIEDWAFYGCTALRGNTQSGSLTFGTNTLTGSETLTIDRGAFYNCNQIRFLKSNYGKMTVKQYGLQRMQGLKTVDFSNTAATLESYAFYNDSLLTSVFLTSVAPIHNNAFKGTPYETNGRTNAACIGQNYGNAKKMTGNQLIVNFFLDMTKVNTHYEDGVREGSQYYIFSKREQNEIFAKKESMLSGAGVSQNNGAGITQYYAFDKNNITYEHIYSWKAKKSATQTNNTVVSLNKIDYSSLANTSKISKSIVDNSESSGFFGSNVTSAAIQQRLTEVRAAASDLESQINGYSTQSLKFQMHPETNFYLTYDPFDWTPKETTFNDGSTYYIMDGYSVPAHKYLIDGIQLEDSSANPVFSSIKKASQRHTGGVTQTIDLCASSVSSLSSYTNYLKQQYKVDGVVYLLHYNVEGRSTALTNREKQDEYRGTDECALIMKKNGVQDRFPIEHEMCHLYGAFDYYCTITWINDAAMNYCQKNFSGDIMIGNYTTPPRVGPVTAYMIGWVDKLDNIFFNNALHDAKKS